MIIKSLYPDIEIPTVDLFTFLMKRTDRSFPESQGMYDTKWKRPYESSLIHIVIFQDALTNKTLRFADVHTQAEKFGRGLAHRFSISKGDVVLVCSLSHIEMPVVILGALWAGAIITTANPDYTIGELRHQIQDSGASVVITNDHAFDKVGKACASCNISSDRLMLLGGDLEGSRQSRHWSSTCTSDLQSPPCLSIASEKDVAFLVYSSGTTGKPKGVRLSHYNVISNILQYQAAESGSMSWDGSKTSGGIPFPSGGDRILACLPFSHIYGLTILALSPIYSGVTTFVLPRFNLKMWCQLIQKHKITFSYVVPPIVLHLAKDPSVTDYDFSSLRMTHSGAAPLTRELVEIVYNRLGIRVKQGYGLSETSPCLYQGTWEDWNVDIGSCGALLPNIEAKICVPVDESNVHSTTLAPRSLPQGEIGELHVRGPNVFLGYHNNQAATLGCRSEDGWFRTGDVGYINSRGNLFITDRVKELIKYKGFQVAPAELEGHLLEFSGVSDCAVLGVWDNKLATEVPRAYIVSQNVDIHDLMEWYKSRVVSYKLLRGGIKVIESIPRNASGKILRRKLKERAQAEFAKEQRNVDKARL